MMTQHQNRSLLGKNFDYLEALENKINEDYERLLKERFDSVIQKAEFLCQMQTPPNFKSAQPNEGWDTNPITREVSKKPSYYEQKSGQDEQAEWKDTFQEWQNDLKNEG